MHRNGTARAAMTSFFAVFNLTLPCHHQIISTTLKAIWIVGGGGKRIRNPQIPEKGLAESLAVGPEKVVPNVRAGY